MIEKEEEEVANLAAELRPKTSRKSGFWVGFPIYWLPMIMLIILGLTGGRPLSLLDYCRCLMIVISALMCVLCVIGLTVFWMKKTTRIEKKEKYTWRDFLAILALASVSCTMGVLIGIFWPSICYGASLLVVFLVAKIME
jgi:nitrate reductase gamma subunit